MSQTETNIMIADVPLSQEQSRAVRIAISQFYDELKKENIMGADMYAEMERLELVDIIGFINNLISEDIVYKNS